MTSDLLRRSSELLGNVRQAYLGHSTRPEWRKQAASGGVVSQILLSLLEAGAIRAAVVTRLLIEQDTIRAEPAIVRSADELRDTQGSKYIPVPFGRALRLLRDEEGPLAVVGLPCHLSQLRALEKHSPELAEKVALRIGLFCGGTNSPRLLYNVLAQQGLEVSDLASFHFREGHWRGEMRAVLKSGQVRTWPYFSTFGLYKNLYLDVLPCCLSCTDHTAEEADISCGDAWLSHLKDDSIKHTLVLARSEQAVEILSDIVGDEDLALTEVDAETVIAAQRRSLVFKKRAIGARQRLGRLFGFHITADDSSWRPAWNDYLGSLCVLLNARLSHHPLARRIIFRLPKPLLKPCMYFIALMKHF